MISCAIWTTSSRRHPSSIATNLVQARALVRDWAAAPVQAQVRVRALVPVQVLVRDWEMALGSAQVLAPAPVQE